MEDEKPKFKIGDEAYTVSISGKADMAEVKKVTVSRIIIYNGKFSYALEEEERSFGNDYLYTFDEAIAVAKTKKRPNTTNK